jgi:excisionase family DNA binding protein
MRRRLVMNEIETTLESAPLPRSPVRRAVVRRQFELSKSGDAMPILLTVGDAADLLRTTRRAIYAMLERRQLPGVIRIRRRVLIRSAELLEWLDQKRAPSLKE